MNTKRKQTIRLNESQLHKIIKESIQRILSEISTDTLRSAERKAREDYDETWANSPIWDDWDGDYPETSKHLAKRHRQMKRFRDELRKRGAWEEGNGCDQSDN